MRYPRKETGEIRSIRLRDGKFGYTKVLPKLFDILDVCTDKIENGDNIRQASSLFVVAVHKSALRRWPKLCNPRIDADTMSDHKFYRVDFDKHTYIYTSHASSPADSTLEPASPQDCVGLEPLAVWDPEQIEDRMSDYFNSVPNLQIDFFHNKLRNLLV